MAQQQTKVLTEWTVQETLSYLRSAIGDANRNPNKLFQAIQYLASLLKDNEKIVEILQSKGLDLVFDLMGDTLEQDNVNFQKGLCTILIVTCSNPAAKQNPSQKNGFNNLANQLKKYLDDKDYAVYVCNAVCNVCHNNPPHRDFAIQSTILEQIIAAMDAHRGKDGGDKVHQAGSMAIRNIGSTPQGQATVGPRGLKAITDGCEHYYDTPGLVKGSLGVLCNLCVHGPNGAAFIETGKLVLWNKIYDDAANAYPIRLGCAAMLHNLASRKEPAVLLAVNKEGLELIIGKILKDAPHDSSLFANTLKATAALMYTLPQNKQLKVRAFTMMIEAGLLQIFNKTLKESKNRELEELIATITVSIVQTSIPLAQKVADEDTPEFLVGCLDNPTPQTQHCCMSIWFYVTDSYNNQRELIKAGLIQFLASEWYGQYIKDDTIRIGLSLILKMIGNTKNYDSIRPHCDGLDKLGDFALGKGGDFAKQGKALKEDVASVRKGNKN
eukprot:238281_1